MNWRFFPVLDPQVGNGDRLACVMYIGQVDAYVSRDLDSRINSREAAAVAAWWDNQYTTHPGNNTNQDPTNEHPNNQYHANTYIALQDKKTFENQAKKRYSLLVTLLL